MIRDNNKEIAEIIYNHLNLPKQIVFENSNSIEYTYNAAGVKLKKTVVEETANPEVRKEVDYLDGFQYAGEVLNFFPTAEGYVRATPVGNIAPGSPPTGYAYSYVYNYTDHLGNVRLSYSMDHLTGKLKILEENHYYPFGLRHGVYDTGGKKDFSRNPGDGIEPEPGLPPVLDYVTRMEYQYKYNGKEWQDELGLGLYDYGWRNYDPTLGRWMNMDPLAESFYGASPYNYVANDPVGQADFDGRDFRIDVIRDENDNITGLKFSATVYIQGSGASNERADELNEEFKDNYGGTKKIDGIDVSVEVNYVYDSNKKQKDLKGDENLLNFVSEEGRAKVIGDVGTIFGKGKNSRTIFHESFHFLGLTDRYDDYTNCPMCLRDDKTPSHPGFENDIMAGGQTLSNIHYKNWVKHAQQRSFLGTTGFFRSNDPFAPQMFKKESYIESSGGKKIDTNSQGLLEDKNGNLYKRIDYGQKNN